jgi:hypothetical protein
MRKLIASLLALGLFVCLPIANAETFSKSSDEVRQVRARRLLLDTVKGRGEYDSMTYAEYTSEILFTPKKDLLVSSVDPRINYCNETCWYEVSIYNNKGNLLVSEEESGTDIETFKGVLSKAIQLNAGAPYRIEQRVWTTASVGIFTTGTKTRVRGQGSVEFLGATSSGFDISHRGAISSQMRGQIINKTAR